MSKTNAKMLTVLALLAPQPGWSLTFIPARPADPYVHDCPAYNYPSAERLSGIGGATTLMLRINANGSVKSSAVKQSSGNAALDRAAGGCVARWRYHLGIENGKPIAAGRQVAIIWKPLLSTQKDPADVNGNTECAPFYRDVANRRLKGPTTLSYRVGPDGKLQAMTLVKSSGNTELDHAAAACIAGMHLTMARAAAPNGTWKTRVDWPYSDICALCPGGSRDLTIR